eukprot:10013-Heterococcus_DN1.PRE.2
MSSISHQRSRSDVLPPAYRLNISSSYSTSYSLTYIADTCQQFVALVVEICNSYLDATSLRAIRAHRRSRFSQASELSAYIWAQMCSAAPR